MNYFKNKVLDSVLDKSQLIIFDMNGLMLDDESLQHQAFNIVVAEYGLSVTAKYWTKNCVGRRTIHFLTELMAANKVQISADQLTMIVQRKNDCYQTLLKDKLSGLVRPGVLELIDYLSLASKSLVLCSSASCQEISVVLTGLQLSGKFGFIVSGEEVERGKPDPAIYLEVLRQSGALASECLAFEDADAGIISAHAASIECIAVPNAYTLGQPFSGARFVIDSLTQNAKII